MSITADDYVDEAVEAFRAALYTQIEAHGVPDDPPAGLARRAAIESTASRSWTDAAGPFYDTDGVRVVLGNVSKQAVSQRVRAGRLLGLRLAADGSGRSRLVYPACQFRTGVLAHIPIVLAAAGFDDARPVTGWTIAHWLANPGEDGLSPIDLLAAGHVDRVLDAAHEIAVSLGVNERDARNAS